MTREEFRNWVYAMSHARDYYFQQIMDDQAREFREHDPALAELLRKRDAADQAVVTYCKERLESRP
jgi:hypothetical protein